MTEPRSSANRAEIHRQSSAQTRQRRHRILATIAGGEPRVHRQLGLEIAFQFFGRRRVGLTDRP
jgi:hypothetical protein